MTSTWWDRRTLRFRVLAGIVTLMVLAFIAIGITTVLVLSRFLVGRLDQQLKAASSRYVGASQSRYPVGFGDARGQADDTVAARLRDGRVMTAGLAGDASPIAVTSHERMIFTTMKVGHFKSWDLGPAIGDYRLYAVRLDGGDVAVIGLPLRPVHETIAELLVVELIAFGVVLIATIALGGRVIALSMRPLTRVTATAQRVTESSLTDDDPDLSARVPTSEAATEVGQLGVAFNLMLDHVEASLLTRRDTEERLRRFIADASHELRTPVAAIRGHAESVRHTDEPVPAEVAESLARIESEAMRMGVLVDDLLLLARLDAGRPLAHDAVDLSRIAIDATSDARVAGRDHRWSLDLPADPVAVTGDAHRLHQVLANLLTNARIHTPAGTAVETAITTEGGGVVLSVTDDGPGLAPEVKDRAFERFFRADAVRAPKTGSSGLGLAIVDAVVRAHGGSVEVTSRPGRTRFEVRLPATPAGADGGDAAQAPTARVGREAPRVRT